MKSRILTLIIVLVCFTAQVQAQFAVFDAGNLAQNIKQVTQSTTVAGNTLNNFKEVQKLYNQTKDYYDKLKSINDLVRDARKVRDAILLVGEISNIYVTGFGKMLSDPHFRQEELAAISNGYTILLDESANMLLEIKDVVNVNGLSMTDYERMDIINYVYDRLRSHRNLVLYFTRKNISVSYLRAQKEGDADRVVALYGNPDERYW